MLSEPAMVLDWGHEYYSCFREIEFKLVRNIDCISDGQTLSISSFATQCLHLLHNVGLYHKGMW